MVAITSKLLNGKIIEVSDINEAVELATKWREERGFDLFRGQIYPWLPKSSFTRWQESNNEEGIIQSILDRYFDWLDQHEKLSSLKDAEALAIAQHFGIPTNFVDFTSSPDVAALFSRDRDPNAEFESNMACIYCISWKALSGWFESLLTEKAEKLQIYPESVSLDYLHRMNLQRGSFLHAPGDWYSEVPMDCIVFERAPILNKQERVMLYPPTSHLEEEMNDFFQLNKVTEGIEYFEKHYSGSIIRLNIPTEDIATACFSDNTLKIQPSWSGLDDSWRMGLYYKTKNPIIIKFPVQHEKMGNDIFAASMVYQLDEVLKGDSSLSVCPLEIVIEPTPDLLEKTDAKEIGNLMTRAWNAMSMFDYSQAQKLQCLEKIVIFGTTGVGYWSSNNQMYLAKMNIGKRLILNPENLNRWCKITLGSNSGTVISTIVCLGELVGSLDSGLVDSLSNSGSQLLEHNPLELMTKVREPKYLFDFSSLLECFVNYFIPMQLLLNEPGRPVIFSPGELNYIGNE